MKGSGKHKSAQECILLPRVALAVRFLKCRSTDKASQPEFARRRAIYSGANPDDSL